MKMLNTIMTRLTAGLPVLVAEAGVNYYDIAKKMNISLIDAAKLMIKEAHFAGIHAIKFQSYKATELAAKNSPSYWDLLENPVTSQRQLFTMFDHFGENEYAQLAEYANKIGIEFFSTAFDRNAVDYLDSLMNVYKISSSDLSNIPFIEYQAKKNKPILISIGASNIDEIDCAIEHIRKYNNKQITILHCVLEYPTPMTDANLYKIRTLKNKYQDCFIGYSDHTKPTVDCDIIKIAYSLGAQLIEKHFTLDKSLSGNDHFHSMDKDDAINILNALNKTRLICGTGDLICLPGEKCSRLNARRSLVSVRDIKAGTIVTKEMIKEKRPGTGISPSDIDKLIGKTAIIDIDDDITLQWDMFN